MMMSVMHLGGPLRSLEHEAATHVKVILERLTLERDQLKAAICAKVAQLDAVNLSIQAIEGLLQPSPEIIMAPEPEPSGANPFPPALLAWHAYEVLRQAPQAMTRQEIYEAIPLTVKCTMKGVSNALYRHPEVFALVRPGYFWIHRSGETR